MTAGKGGDKAEAGKETEQTEDTGASHWSSLLLCTPFQPPWIRSFSCRDTCCLSQSFAMCPPEDAGSAPSPHRSAPTSLTHTGQGGSIHSERGGVRGVSVAGPAPPPPPQQLFPPTPFLSFLPVMTSPLATALTPGPPLLPSAALLPDCRDAASGRCRLRWMDS